MPSYAIRNYLTSFFRYFGIGSNNDETPVGPRLEQYSEIGPEGSSVDPAPCCNFVSSNAVLHGSKSIEDFYFKNVLSRNKAEQLPKASLCAGSISDDIHSTAEPMIACSDFDEEIEVVADSQGTKKTTESRSSETKTEFSPAGEDGVNALPSLPSKDAGDAEEDAGDAIENTDTTSAAYLERLIQRQRKATEHRSTSPASIQNDAETQCKESGDEGVCALYRLCPQLAPGAMVKYPITQTPRLRGRVMFNAPIFSEGDFELRILHDKVCLEFVQIDSDEIHGYIRVLNTTYAKQVTVDYTTNEWETIDKMDASWMETVNRGRMDRFKFTIPGRRSVGDLKFSVRFNGILDDNKGRTYTILYEKYI